MAGSYTLPQTRVFQEFAQTPNDVTQNLNPFIIGPSYELMRYAKESERELCSSTKNMSTPERYKYNASTTLNWARPVDKAVVDKAWYGVTFEDAYVTLGEKAVSSAACLDDPDNTGSGTKFEFTLSEGKTTLANTRDPSKLEFGVAVKAGDYLAYTSGDGLKYTKIREVSIGKPTGDEVTVTLRKKGSTANELDKAFSVVTADYRGEKPVNVNLTVKGNKLVSWSSGIAGINGTEEWTPADTAKDLGLGLKIKKGSTTTIADGVYILALALQEPYARDTVTVADRIPSSGTVTFVRRFASIAARDEDLTVSTSGVTIEAGAMVDIGAYDGDHQVFDAEAYLDQRNLRMDHTDRVYSVRTDSEIATELGAFDTPDNPLAYAAHIMLLNNANKAIKFIGLESDDMGGYTEALKRASVTTEVYAFCPLTEDRAIIDAVVADCNRLSAPEEKSWRIAIFSMPTPESVDVIAADSGATCTVSAAGVLEYADGSFTENVRADDVVSVLSGGEWVAYKVDAVKSNTQLQLIGVSASLPAGTRFCVTHKRQRGEYVEAIAETSAGFRDHRAYNVFPNRLRASDGNMVPGMYGAAAVTALACSVAPQQPITNVEIKGFADLPDVHGKFSRDELNEIAAGGTLILMQDKPNGTVYVRHQISTAYRDGNPNTTELSLTKNLDSISYYFANRFAPYIGRYNITDDLIAELRGILDDGLTYLETTTETNRLVGPQILTEGTEVRALYRSAEKDKAYANVALNLPAPFNNFDLHLQVI